jgi:UDP-N-acetylglucosamine:LPS N-acetylglucosamine transferase
VSHLASDNLSAALQNTDFVICRSGYSTIMDLHALEIENIIFVPTPGQTEQEYLAQYHEEKCAKSLSRKKIKAISQHKLHTSHLREFMQSQ